MFLLYKLRTLLITALLLISIPTGVLAGEKPKPPVAPQIHHETIIHGEKRVDPYHWMQDRADPRVLDYVKAENKYAETMFSHTADLQEQITSEMISRLPESITSPPVHYGGYEYFVRLGKEQSYPVFYRQKLPAGDEKVILDVNRLAKNHSYLSLGMHSVSPDGRLLAYSTDTRGDEIYTLYIKDLETGQLLPDVIPNTFCPIVWSQDSKTIFYINRLADSTAKKVYRHHLGNPVDKAELVYAEPDPSFEVQLTSTRDHQFLVLNTCNMDTQEVYVLPADRPDSNWQVVIPRQPGIRYSVEHRNGEFYLLTNEEAPNGKVIKLPAAHLKQVKPAELVAHRENVQLEQFMLFDGHLVLGERTSKGEQQLQIIDLPSGESHYINFPEPIYAVGLGENPEFNTHQLRLTYVSLVTPETVYDYDLNRRELKAIRQIKVSGYDPARYRSERIWAKAADGTRVPITLVYARNLKQDGTNPLLLQGYGCYGISLNPTFDSGRLSLLERGVIIAIAHVRGGGELGPVWAKQGSLLQKKNSFTDFITCAEHLILQGYTSPNRLAIQGASAGGLLVASVTNMRPDLFRAVVAEVPAADLLTIMLDQSNPGTAFHYAVFGNPQEPVHYDYLKSYSPYENVRVQEYPSILVTSGLNDPRVMFWEPTKWVAKLRRHNTGDNLLLLKTNMGAGHFGGTGLADNIREKAFKYAFILDQLGVKS